MKTCYTIRMPNRVNIAIADLVPYVDKGINCYLITRINVPISYRRLGCGTQLLNAILKAARKDNCILYIHPMTSGDMSNEQLISWYIKHGFTLLDSGELKLDCREDNTQELGLEPGGDALDIIPVHFNGQEHKLLVSTLLSTQVHGGTYGPSGLSGANTTFTPKEASILHNAIYKLIAEGGNPL